MTLQYCTECILHIVESVDRLHLRATVLASCPSVLVLSLELKPPPNPNSDPDHPRTQRGGGSVSIGGQPESDAGFYPGFYALG